VYKILKDAAPDFHDLENLGDPTKMLLFHALRHANLWYGMRHEEYADEAPLLKVVI
jgi:hypothetical protein